MVLIAMGVNYHQQIIIILLSSIIKTTLIELEL
jgi:hypothetical protein